MKYQKIILLNFLALFMFTFNISAINNKEISEKSIPIKSKSSFVYGFSKVKLENQTKNSIYKINNKYYLNKVEIFGVIEKNTSNQIVLSYNNNGKKIESWYKYIDAAKGYAHTKNTVDETTNTFETAKVSYLFFYKENKCSNSSNDLVAANCTNAYDVKQVVINDDKATTLNYSSWAKIIGECDNIIENYTISNTKFIDKDYILRNSKKQVSSIKSYSYTNNKKVTYEYDTKLYKKTSDYFDYWGSAYTDTYYYNKKGKVTSRELYKVVRDKHYSINSYYSYYVNNKRKATQIINSTDDEKTKASKLTYNKNGTKNNYKIRTYYNNGKIKKHTYLKYTKNKKKYLDTTNYNKKGKAIKSTRAIYNKKGKKISTKKIKVAKANRKW